MRAPAKLTRRLRIVGRRPDGYHLLAAEMVTVDLYDELEFSVGDSFDLVDAVDWVGPSVGGRSSADSALAMGAISTTTGQHASADVASSSTAVPNLVQLALSSVGRSASVHLTKRIPAAAGLGGGSADAAAVLRWAGVSDVAAAAGLGADVPFCLIGGRALVGGVGEIVEPLPHEPAEFLLVVPYLHVSTPAVYAAWDSLHGPIGELENDLEPAALVVEPRLRWWRDLVGDLSGQSPHLGGSGGTWWLEGDPGALADVQQAVTTAVVAAGESALVQLVAAVPAS